MTGLALEGGGARGAYHIGVYKALHEKGFKFDGFVGTSIGAINAAMLVQGDYDKLVELWQNISMEKILEKDWHYIIELVENYNKKPNRELLKNVIKVTRKLLKEHGVSTAKIKQMLLEYIDEEKIRNSGKDFGLVTISITDRKPYELMLDDIPKGKLHDYIMASACLPGFRPERIDGKIFIDGALYNNCPFNLLYEKNYDEIIVVRTFARGIMRKIRDSQKIKLISPKSDLGAIMFFEKARITENFKLGYNDGLQFVQSFGK